VSLLRRAAIELLRSDAGLPVAQIANMFGRSRQWAYYLIASPEAAERDGDLKQVLVETRRRLDPRCERWRSPPFCDKSFGRRDTRRWLPSLGAYRQAAHLTINELGERAGIPRETVSRLERLHRRARSGTAQALAFVLGMPVEHLEAVPPLVIAPQKPLQVRPVVARRLARTASGAQVCSDCGLSKPLDCFTRIRACREGFYGRCKGCRAARARERYRTDAKFRAREQERARRKRGFRQVA
jgi:DNA-binding XRE family transcriptional regulator